jgi:hypothetical protein
MATITTPAGAPEPQAPINHFARIIGALLNPLKTFEDIARRPSWIAPVVLMSVIWLILNIVLVKRVDWNTVTRNQIEKNKFVAAQMEKLNDEQRALAYTKGAERAKVTRYVRGVIGWPLLIVVTAGIYLGVFKLFAGARVNYGQAMALVAHAYIPLSLKELLGIPVVLLKDAAAIDPDNFLASNIAALLPGDAPIWQIALGASFDLFLLWAIVLVAIAFSAADPKKVSLAKGLGIVFGVWLAITLLFTGLGSLAS